nr:MAG TPA: hypothetical protein [Caudoviricetes sp.]
MQLPYGVTAHCQNDKLNLAMLICIEDLLKNKQVIYQTI